MSSAWGIEISEHFLIATHAGPPLFERMNWRGIFDVASAACLPGHQPYTKWH